jgi:hypothetical protein
MDELIAHLKAERFGELKDRLKKCATQAEQNQILGTIKTKELEQFMTWLQADGACTAALYGVITGLLLKRQFPA